MVINQPQTIETIRGYQYVNEPPVTMMQQQPGYDFYQVETDRPTNNLFGSGYQMVNDKSPNLETYGQAQIVEQFPSSVYVENVPSTFTSDKRPTVTAQQVPNSGTVHIETDPSSLNLYQLPSENSEVNIAENTYVQSIGVSNIPYPGVIKRVPVTIVTPGHVYVLFTPNGTQVLTNNFQNTGGHFIPATDAQQVDPNTYGLYDPSNHYIVQQQLGQNQVLYNQYPYFQPGMIHQFIRPDGPGLQQFPSNTQYIGQNPSDFNPIQQQPGYYQPFPNQYPNFEPGMNQYVRPDNPGFPPTPLISPGFEKPEYPDLGNIISLKFDTTKSYEELCQQISNFIKRINAKATIYLKVSDGQYLGRIRGTILIHNFEHSYLNKQQIILLAKQTICVDGSLILTMVHHTGGKIERITVITPTATEELTVPEESTPVDTVSTTEKSKDNQSTTNVATEKSTEVPVTAAPTSVDTASTTEKVKGDNPQLLFPIDNEQFQDTSSKSFLTKIIQKGIQFVFGFGKTFSKNSLKPSTPLNISPGFEKPEYEDLGNTISLEFDTTKSYEELCLEIIDFIQRVNAEATIYLKVNNGQYLGRIRGTILIDNFKHPFLNKQQIILLAKQMICVDGSLILTTKHNINGEIEKITVITPSTMEVFMVPDEPTSVDPVSTTEKAKDDQSTTVTAEKSKETPVTAVPTFVDTVSTTEAIKGDDPQSTTIPTEKSTETPVTAVPTSVHTVSTTVAAKGDDPQSTTITTGTSTEAPATADTDCTTEEVKDDQSSSVIAEKSTESPVTAVPTSVDTVSTTEAAKGDDLQSTTVTTEKSPETPVTALPTSIYTVSTTEAVKDEDPQSTTITIEKPTESPNTAGTNFTTEEAKDDQNSTLTTNIYTESPTTDKQATSVTITSEPEIPPKPSVGFTQQTTYTDSTTEEHYSSTSTPSTINTETTSGSKNTRVTNVHPTEPITNPDYQSTPAATDNSTESPVTTSDVSTSGAPDTDPTIPTTNSQSDVSTSSTIADETTTVPPSDNYVPIVIDSDNISLEFDTTKSYEELCQQIIDFIQRINGKATIYLEVNNGQYLGRIRGTILIDNFENSYLNRQQIILLAQRTLCVDGSLALTPEHSVGDRIDRITVITPLTVDEIVVSEEPTTVDTVSTTEKAKDNQSTPATTNTSTEPPVTTSDVSTSGAPDTDPARPTTNSQSDVSTSSTISDETTVSPSDNYVPTVPASGNTISLEFDTTKSYEELCLQIINFIQRINGKATIYLEVNNGQYLGRIRGTILIDNLENSYLNRQQIILLAQRTICVDGSLTLTPEHSVGNRIDRITVITPLTMDEIVVSEEPTTVDTVSTTEKEKDNQSTSATTNTSTEPPVTSSDVSTSGAPDTDPERPTTNSQSDVSTSSTISDGTTAPTSDNYVPTVPGSGNTISLEFDTTKSYEELCLQIIDFIQRINGKATIYLEVNNGQYLGRIRGTILIDNLENSYLNRQQIILLAQRTICVDGSLTLTPEHSVGNRIDRITVITPLTMDEIVVSEEPTTVDTVSTTEKAKDNQSTPATTNTSTEPPVTSSDVFTSGAPDTDPERPTTNSQSDVSTSSTISDGTTAPTSDNYVPTVPDSGNISLEFDTTKSYEELCQQIIDFIQRINGKATIYLEVNKGQYLGRIRGTILIDNFENSYLNKQQIILLAQRTLCVDGSLTLTPEHSVGDSIDRITVITPLTIDKIVVSEEPTTVDTVSTTEKAKDNQSTPATTNTSTEPPVTTSDVSSSGAPDTDPTRPTTNSQSDVSTSSTISDETTV
jgi:predicted secreted protein